MRHGISGLVLWVFSAIAAQADGEKAGEFDYYVLSLSWSPNWCVREGDARGSDQCDARHDHGWILHGLWPQFHQGWPSYCRTPEAPPTRRMTREMEDIQGSAGLAWHQWKKHGTCSGLSAADYFALSRSTYDAVERPEVFRKLDASVKLPAEVVEEAFLKANPELERDMITVTCKQGYIEEVRLCLSRDLNPVPCGRDVIRDCTAKDALFDPIR
ncbi:MULTISPECIES: ribonuclease T2 [unclassified Ruegeria]|uniref:ribonuclease T2 family protein n=1 Tax=unclassified Ruegeria TaxID=2625375 RepID=UPI001490D6FD|nr:MULTISPECIES: ribonuclease T2 [unclassified Ruegeria]NOD32957.1 ribonuclease T [Ruegeria sp. HKCCD7296]NOE42671.1 ribonuclease T [Ruegeria sp. HKCCD7319]